MSKIILHKERCKACGYCISFCPKGIISLTNNFNALGYKTIAIEEEKCVGCGTCYTMCPDSVIEIINSTEKEVK